MYKEAERISAEAHKFYAETDRMKAEQTKLYAEADRMLAEATKLKAEAELMKVQAEWWRNRGMSLTAALLFMAIGAGLLIAVVVLLTRR